MPFSYYCKTAPPSNNFLRSMMASRFLGAIPSASDRAAAVPAAWPVAIQLGVRRVVASASCVVEIHLPATSKLSIPLGIRHL